MRRVAPDPQEPRSYARVNSVICIDGVHTDYVDGKPGPLESSITEGNLQVWLHLGRDALAGRKRFLLTHSEIFPGTYASTTETADYILKQLRVQRRAVLKWGPMGMQQLSEASRGKFLLIGSPATPRPTTWTSCNPCRYGSSGCAEPAAILEFPARTGSFKRPLFRISAISVAKG